jgi:penicillin-binding protein 2
LAERDRGVRKNKDLPWRERDHALFIAYAPAHAPKYAITVIVEHGGGGSKAAAPIAHDVMLATLKRDSLSKVALRQARVETPPQNERN